MPFQLSRRSIFNRRGVDKRLVEISDLAITLTTVDFGHGRYAGLRSASLQHSLFNDDLSRCDGFVLKSPHQSGKALDFYAYVDGKVSYDPFHMAMVGAAFLQAACILGYKIEWGGLWSAPKDKLHGWDMPHIQIRE